MDKIRIQIIEDILARSIDRIVDQDRLKKRLLAGEKLRVKFGIDPTSPFVHIGRAVPILKLKKFQELGCKIILIIGDFTGVIGDTSDKESERPMLTEDEVKENMVDLINDYLNDPDTSKPIFEDLISLSISNIAVKVPKGVLYSKASTAVSTKSKK